MTCTVPTLFGCQAWFDVRFKDLCQAHDDAYVTGSFRDKVGADLIITGSLIRRRYATLGISCFVYVTTLGTLYWVWKRYK
jgi:hypothetical protein